MRARLGEEFEQFRSALEEPPPVSVRINPWKSAVTFGSTENLAQQVPWCRHGFYLDHRPVFTLDPRFHAGAYYVQEASSMLLEQAVLQAIDVRKPLTVLDLCAAPGGKSTHLLSLLSRESLLVSNEVIRSRVPALIENIEKWGNENVIVTQNDPADFQALPDFFDLILVDAPCSGEGLFRKEPQAMEEWSMKGVELCSLRQRRILADVVEALKPGGVLLYSTCTYNEKENEENLRWVKSQTGLEPITISVSEGWNFHPVDSGYQLYPHRVKGEGFFLAAVRKTGTSSKTVKAKDMLKYPSNSHMKVLSTWIDVPESSFFFLHNQTVRFLPLEKKAEAIAVFNYLSTRMAGTAMAEIVRDKYVPDHALGLSTRLAKNAFHVVKVDQQEALHYLRKNPISPGEAPKGFAMVEFDGLGLGWINVLGNRVNNMYPAAYRIRMGH